MPEHKKGVVPRLRFPEFRNTGPWEEKRLGEICDVLQGYGFPEKFQGKKNGKYPFCKVSDITYAVNKTGGAIARAENYVDDEDIEALRARLVPIGATVFAKIGEALRLNKRALVSVECLIDNNVVGLRGRDNQTKDRFVFYLSQKIDLNEYCGGAVPAVNKSTLESIKLFVPEIEEQQKIADCLSSLDEVIELEAKKLEALKIHKKGLMQQLFPREGETTPRLHFPEFRNAGPWEVKSIKELSDKVTQGGTPNTSINEYWDGDIPWITPAEMGNDAEYHYIANTNRTISMLGLKNSSAELLPKNSVIISSRAPIGYVAINKLEMATNQGCKGIIPKVDVYYDFLYFCLLNAQRHLNDLGAGAGFKELSTSVLKKFQIPVPKLPEQQKIADCLSSLDRVIELEAQKLEALKTHKKGLLQQLFPQEVD